MCIACQPVIYVACMWMEKYLHVVVQHVHGAEALCSDALKVGILLPYAAGLRHLSQHLGRSPGSKACPAPSATLAHA